MPEARLQRTRDAYKVRVRLTPYDGTVKNHMQRAIEGARAIEAARWRAPHENAAKLLARQARGRDRQ